MTDFDPEFQKWRRLLDATPFGDLITDEVLASMYRRNLAAELLPPPLPTVRKFMDRAPLPYYEVDPTLDDFEAETDLERRAEALYYNQIEATCARSRSLIQSVKDASLIGMLLQANLVPSEPRRRILPPWYNPRRIKPPTFKNLPNLFDVFGE